MEFGLREILILVGFLIVAGILFDGYRRMRRAKTGSLKSGYEMGGSAENDWEHYRAELPNGGARKVSLGRRQRQDAEAPDHEIDNVQVGDLGGDFGSALDQTMPELADGSVGKPRAVEERAQQREQLREAGTDAHDQTDLFADDELLMAARAEHQARLNKATRRDREREVPASQRDMSPPKPSRQKEIQTEEEPGIPAPDFSEVIVINVMAKGGEFAGADLQRVLMSCGFQYGDMKIYHRHEQHSGKGPKLFSVANVVEPGFFEQEQMDAFSTPGVCMFMKLPGPKRPLHAFDIMMDCARKIANLLDADIKDEHHNPMRQQTAEHYRQRVLDFERKLLAYQAGQRQH